MDLRDSKNVDGSSMLQFTTSKFFNKNTGLFKVFREKVGCCNLGLLESTDIIQQCYVFGFLVSWGTLPYRGLKRTVLYILQKDGAEEGGLKGQNSVDVICGRARRRRARWARFRTRPTKFTASAESAMLNTSTI